MRTPPRADFEREPVSDSSCSSCFFKRGPLRWLQIVSVLRGAASRGAAEQTAGHPRTATPRRIPATHQNCASEAGGLLARAGGNQHSACPR
ncbi:hypothetical protein ACFPRL_14620 [Pseudoclavibacter helvolus]